MKQISNSAIITLNESIKIVFPLFSPLEEVKWVRGWEPEFLYPEKGLLTENLVFKTKSNNTIEQSYNWITSYLDTNQHLVVYTVFTENRVWTIRVQCFKNGWNKTKAEIKYTYTALNKIGISLNTEALERVYRNQLKDWEAGVNYYLKTGHMLET